MKILKATNRTNSTIADDNIKAVVAYNKEHIRIFVNGRNTSLFAIELSRMEINRIIEVYTSGKSN